MKLDRAEELVQLFVVSNGELDVSRGDHFIQYSQLSSLTTLIQEDMIGEEVRGYW